MKFLQQTKKATTEYPGIVQLTNSLNSTSEGMAPTAKALSELNDKVEAKISVVVSKPYVSVPSHISTAVPFTIYMAKSEIEYGDVVSYNVKINDGDIINVPYQEGVTSTQLTVMEGSLGDTVLIEVQSVDSLTNISDFTQVTTILSTSVVLAPQLTNLFDNQLNIPLLPTITVAPFSCYPLDFDTPLEADNFSMVLTDKDSGDIIQTSIMTMPSSGGDFVYDLPTQTDKNLELTLKWITTNEVNVQTGIIDYHTIPAYIQAPTIAEIPNDIDRKAIAVQASEFSIVPTGFRDVHTSTDWQLINAEDNSIIAEKIASKELISTQFTMPTLPIGTSCQVAVRYNGDELASTAFVKSNVFTVSDNVSYDNPFIYPGAFGTFYEETPPEYWEENNGAKLTNVSVECPLLLAELKKPKNAWKLKTQAEWDALQAATYTLADGRIMSTWEGVGGVPFFVLDEEEDSIRLPDTRGMYVEARGFDNNINTGDSHGDMIRSLPGSISAHTGCFNAGSGVFRYTRLDALRNATAYHAGGSGYVAFDISYEVPVGNANKPRAFAALHCTYVGPHA